MLEGREEGCSATGRGGVGDEGFDLVGWHSARGPARLTPAGKDCQGRYRADGEARREVGHGFSVHLRDEQAPCIFSGHQLNLGSDHPARAAPVGPEVHQHREARSADERIEHCR